MLSWIAGSVDLIGLWLIGSKSRLGFLVNILADFLWIWLAIEVPETRGLLLIAIPAIVVNLRGFLRWKHEKENT